jgi:hypothetical protein
MKFIPVKTFDSYVTANIWLGKLQDAGIQCYLKDEYTVTIDPILSNAIGGIKLVVNPADAEAAQTLLAEFDEEYMKSVECPQCGAYHITLVPKPGTSNFTDPIRKRKINLLKNQQRAIQLVSL